MNTTVHPRPWVYHLACGCDVRTPGRILGEPLLKPVWISCGARHQNQQRVLDISYQPEQEQ